MIEIREVAFMVLIITLYLNTLLRVSSVLLVTSYLKYIINTMAFS